MAVRTALIVNRNKRLLIALRERDSTDIGIDQPLNVLDLIGNQCHQFNYDFSSLSKVHKVWLGLNSASEITRGHPSLHFS